MDPLRYCALIALCLVSCSTESPATGEPASPQRSAADTRPQSDANGAQSSGNKGAQGAASSEPFWIYRNGRFNWQGDYSFQAQIDYHDTKGAQPGHRYAIAVKILGKWGGFQPFAGGAHFDVSRYKYLVYSLKPTVPEQVFATGFAAENDVADGKPVTVSGAPYGPTPVAGQWGTYKIPLSEFGLTNRYILKFTIADVTGLDSNLFYVDDIGFTVD